MQNKGINQYRKLAVDTLDAENISGYKLIQMLITAVVEKIGIAKSHLLGKEYKLKGQNIGSAITILNVLQASLDLEKGGDIAKNLEYLYEYTKQKLLEASVENKVEYLDESLNLLQQIKLGWDGIESQVN
ncbi:MAG: flagellar export chaperone FliS [Gammaproteobacteria bacterium]